MAQLHDSDLVDLQNIEIVEIGDQKYVNLTYPQIAILLSEKNPYHDVLHSEILNYEGQGISIGYTEDVRASFEELFGLDLSDEKQIEENYPLAAPMLNSWELIQSE